MSNYFRAFVHGKEAYYASTSLGGDRVDYVCLGVYSTGGGTTGEFMVEWVRLKNGKSVPKLEVFSDAWRVLVAEFGDVLALLRDSRDITPEEFCAKLKELGIKDQTPRVNPYAKTVDRTTALLRECLATLDTWADLVPAVSLRSDLRRFLNR